MLVVYNILILQAMCVYWNVCTHTLYIFIYMYMSVRMRKDEKISINTNKTCIRLIDNFLFLVATSGRVMNTIPTTYYWYHTIDVFVYDRHWNLSKDDFQQLVTLRCLQFARLLLPFDVVEVWLLLQLCLSLVQFWEESCHPNKTNIEKRNMD